MTRTIDLTALHVTAQLSRSRVIAQAAFDYPEQAELASHALLRGGVGCLEISAPTLGVLRTVRRVDGMLVGAGDVHTVEQAELAAQGGAHFATAPATNMEVVHACRELDLPFFPGVATPSEIERLALLGLRTLRLFPAEALGGVRFLSVVGALYPEVQFIVAGGVGLEAVNQYLQAPSVLAVTCGGFVRGDLLRARNFDRIEWLARDVRRVSG
jgi:2-dehydro-3-deoxyphosphogluconate aldolase/(4S)-4-hydroxy-2-oxoglutarate aldolase